MCACPRDKVIETYIGVRTLEERGGVNVLVCSCLGGENDVCVGGGGGWATRGRGLLQIKSEVSIF